MVDFLLLNDPFVSCIGHDKHMDLLILFLPETSDEVKKIPWRFLDLHPIKYMFTVPLIMSLYPDGLWPYVGPHFVMIFKFLLYRVST